MLKLSVSKPDWQRAIRALRVSAERKAELVAEAAGAETIAYLRSLTDEMRPPARRGGQERPAHPGHWADITGQLAASYGWEVESIPGGVRLVLTNGADYAVYLEDRNGFFVLTGVADPGGPVEEQIRAAMAVIAPEWQVKAGPVQVVRGSNLDQGDLR